MDLLPLLVAAEQETAASWLARLPQGWPLVLAAACLAAGLWLLVPPSGKLKRLAGALLAAVGIGLFVARAPLLAGVAAPAVFWILAVLAVAPAVAAISVRDPVYSALWFALSLLAVAGLFLYQGAFFLGIATVAVYAGAIVVTFLFVLMLAQPEGHAFYDRLGWGRFSAAVACTATASLVAVLVYAVGGLDAGLESQVVAVLAGQSDAQGQPLVARRQLRHVRLLVPAETEAGETGQQSPARLELLLVGPRLSAARRHDVEQLLTEGFGDLHPTGVEIDLKYVSPEADVLAPYHVAHLGDQLFGPRLVAVEVAGALLLAALVGAVSIATRDMSPDDRQEAAA